MKLLLKSRIIGVMLVSLTCMVFLLPDRSEAQTGILRGGSLRLSNGVNTVTLNLPATPTTHTLTFPAGKNNGIQYLYNDGTGNLQWGFPVDTTNNVNTVLYNTDHAQIVPLPGTPLFDVGYAANATGPAAGAKISAVENGGSNTYVRVLSDSARSLKTANSFGTYTALLDTAFNAGSGVQTALDVSVSGSGTNYAAITKGGFVHIGTVQHTANDSLHVDGNVLISGQHGLMISNSGNGAGTMGLATLVANGGVSSVVVSTTKVTANSRIILTTQSPSPNAAAVGAVYVSARTAGTSFTIKSTSGTDQSKVAWLIIQP